MRATRISMALPTRRGDQADFLDALGALREVAADRKPPRPDRRDRASCVDMAMPVMIMAAEAFGKTGAKLRKSWTRTRRC